MRPHAPRTARPARVLVALPLVLLSLAALVLVAPRAARAQGAAQSTNLPLSVRAAGMANCSNAVFWGDGPDAWSNPALLGYQEGVRYEHARTQLVPDLANDVFLTSKRVAAGAGGVGFLFAGKPTRGLGSVRLDYGTSEATGPTGEPLGTFDAFEDVRSWGTGVSVGRLARSLTRAFAGRSPRLLRHVDVAVGMNHKDVRLDLAPALPGLPGAGQGSGKADDRGIFFRVSPYNSFDGPGFSRALDGALRLAVDVAYGASTLNRGAPLVVFPADDRANPMLQERHKGWAGRVALQPVALERSLKDHHLAWLERSLFPAVSLGGAWDRQVLDFQRFDPGSGTFVPAHSDIVDRGFELTLLNVFALRRGHVSDPDGAVHGTSTGWGVGFAFEGALGFRYDHASIPQATDPTTGVRFSNVRRNAWSVSVDPVRWARRKS